MNEYITLIPYIILSHNRQAVKSARTAHKRTTHKPPTGRPFSPAPTKKKTTKKTGRLKEKTWKVGILKANCGVGRPLLGKVEEKIGKTGYKIAEKAEISKEQRTRKEEICSRRV